MFVDFPVGSLTVLAAVLSGVSSRKKSKGTLSETGHTYSNEKAAFAC